MAHPKDTRDNVRKSYIGGLPLTVCAVTNEVSYDTARDWKAKAKANGDDWDTARAAYRVSGMGIDDLNNQLVEDIVRQIVMTTREVENDKEMKAADKVTLLASLTDAYSKFSKSFARVNPKYSGLTVALDTLKTVMEYLVQHDQQALKAIQPHLDEIGAIVGKRYAS